MIRRVEITNYRCLRNVSLTLEPLTVLVGANGSGKSSVVAALQLPWTMQPNAGHFLPVSDRWELEANLHVSVKLDGGQARWESHPNKATTTSGAYPSCQVLHLDLAKVREPVQLQEARQLQSNGAGLANLLYSLPDRTRSSVSQSFCALVPHFAGIRLRSPEPGKHRVEFQDRWQTGRWYEPQQVSDGSILLLAFLLLQHQTPAPQLIAIEEPERGLHPYLLGELVKVLRQLATGKLGAAIQVVLATHSAELLNFVEPQEVRFLSRSKETGETIVEVAPDQNDPEWAKVLREYDDSLSGVWLSGGLGGVP